VEETMMRDDDRADDRRKFLRRWGVLPVALALPAWRANAAETQELTATPPCSEGEEPTPRQMEGPFFKPRSPQRTSLLVAGLHGTRILVSGLVLSTRCKPVAGALVDMEARFRAGVRRILAPEEMEQRRERKKQRPTPNAGKRVRGAIDRISDTYVALNLDTNTIYDVNPAAEALFASAAERLVGTPLGSYIAPSDQMAWRELEARLDAGEDAGPLEVTIARPNGDFVPVELTIASHTIAGRRLAMFLVRERLKRIA
jgi:PAS domain S-box-containing protein